MTFTEKLVQRIQQEHLCFVEFSKNSFRIRKQLGNDTGSIIEIEFNDAKRIKSIVFKAGGYNEPKTLKKEFDILFDIIYNL